MASFVGRKPSAFADQSPAELTVFTHITCELHLVRVGVQTVKPERREVLVLIELNEGIRLCVEKVAGQRSRALGLLLRLDTTEGSKHPGHRSLAAWASGAKARWQRWLSHGTRARTRRMPSAAAAALNPFSVSPRAMPRR